MSKIAVLVFVLFSCIGNGKEQSKSFQSSQDFNINHFIDLTHGVDPYSIEFDLVGKTTDEYDLQVHLEFERNSYITSHYAHDMKGRFVMEFEDNEFIESVNALEESPAAVKEENPWSVDRVKIVRVPTTYTQRIKCKSPENFVVKGQVRFVIEPKCTMEYTDFSIINEDGKMRLVKKN